MGFFCPWAELHGFLHGGALVALHAFGGGVFAAGLGGGGIGGAAGRTFFGGGAAGEEEGTGGGEEEGNGFHGVGVVLGCVFSRTLGEGILFREKSSHYAFFSKE